MLLFKPPSWWQFGTMAAGNQPTCLLDFLATSLRPSQPLPTRAGTEVGGGGGVSHSCRPAGPRGWLVMGRQRGGGGRGPGAQSTVVSCELLGPRGRPGSLWMPGAVAELDCPGSALPDLSTATLWVRAEWRCSLEASEEGTDRCWELAGRKPAPLGWLPACPHVPVCVCMLG